ncbi:MAG: transposase [Solirubrobacterales bacterium]
MPSKYRARNYRPNQLIHAQIRGYNRKPVFLDAKDQHEFRSTLRRQINLTPAPERPKLLATASMRNHQHLFTQNRIRGDATARVITATKISYAAYFNDRYGESGPVFEMPFKARLVQGGDDIINVITYIHLNPDHSLRAANSTHAVYTGESRDPFIDDSIPLRAFGGRENYIEFFNDTANLRAARAAAKRRLS